MHLKLLQKERFKKTAVATSESIGNKIADKITKTLPKKQIKKYSYPQS